MILQEKIFKKSPYKKGTFKGTLKGTFFIKFKITTL